VRRTLVIAVAAVCLSSAGLRADSPEETAQPVVRMVRSQPVVAQPAPLRTAQPATNLGVTLFSRDFDEITTNIQQKVDRAGNMTLPTDVAQMDRLFTEPGAEPLYSPIQTYFAWTAPEIWHKSLYFDDIQLERYGQSRAPLLQPFLSGAHFFGTLPILPYKLGLNGPFEMTSNLGYYRPGSAAPCVGRRLPWEWDAALYEAGFWVGGVFMVP